MNFEQAAILILLTSLLVVFALDRVRVELAALCGLCLAVARGASIDFLTPIGHHNNTSVMGLAGYRFSDFLKAGWPVTAVVAGTAACALWLSWL